MDKPRPCGCKGKRTCLRCEEEYGLDYTNAADIETQQQFGVRNQPSSISTFLKYGVGISTCPKDNLSDAENNQDSFIFHVFTSTGTNAKESDSSVQLDDKFEPAQISFHTKWTEKRQPLIAHLKRSLLDEETLESVSSQSHSRPRTPKTRRRPNTAIGITRSSSPGTVKSSQRFRSSVDIRTEISVCASCNTEVTQYGTCLCTDTRPPSRKSSRELDSKPSKTNKSISNECFSYFTGTKRECVCGKVDCECICRSKSECRCEKNDCGCICRRNSCECPRTRSFIIECAINKPCDCPRPPLVCMCDNKSSSRVYEEGVKTLPSTPSVINKPCDCPKPPVICMCDNKSSSRVYEEGVKTLPSTPSVINKPCDCPKPPVICMCDNKSSSRVYEDGGKTLHSSPSKKSQKSDSFRRSQSRSSLYRREVHVPFDTCISCLRYKTRNTKYVRCAEPTKPTSRTQIFCKAKPLYWVPRVRRHDCVSHLGENYAKNRARSNVAENWEEPHTLYPDPLRWQGKTPYQWEKHLRHKTTDAPVVCHPHMWMPVGRQHYSNRNRTYWCEAISSMYAPCRCLPSAPSCTNSCSNAMLCWPQKSRENSYVYCPYCNKAWPGWDLNSYKGHPNHVGTPIDYPGIFIELDWLSNEEEAQLLQGMDEMPWDTSQSGRRKQNFGPKCNFKKMRMVRGDFNGFPLFSKFVQEKFKDVPLLQDYQTIEQCSLEYDPLKGASIDPHIDDCWVWGERIVTVNLLADSVLTMTPYRGEAWRYNLPQVQTYHPVVDKSGVVINSQSKPPDGKDNFIGKNENYVITTQKIVVRIPMPRLSLLVIYGPARYAWEHQVLREDIPSRRLCLAYREFTPPYLPGGKKEAKGSDILQVARNFWNHTNNYVTNI